MRIKKKIILRVTVILSALVLLFGVLDRYGSVDSAPVYPDYDMKSLEETAGLEEIYEGLGNENDYEQIFLQTGLGKEGLRQLSRECENVEEFEKALAIYQMQLFRGKGRKQMVALKKGDVLVSMSQRLCYYPHGHAAIYIGGEKKEILEARSYVAGSCMCKKEKWEKLSSFVVLRLKEEVVDFFMEREGENPSYLAAEYAKENLNGLPYSLFKDVRLKDNEIPRYTQCAHLVWCAYYAVGLDIDQNRGLIVKPKDFLESDVFEVVQVFGINPKSLLKMRNE